jgi:hypothetical protein
LTKIKYNAYCGYIIPSIPFSKKEEIDGKKNHILPPFHLNGLDRYLMDSRATATEYVGKIGIEGV